ncbi:MAG: FAD binding domain-containing protein [Melioribacteraceae bacterium]|nr:FAD binding domain-containing protein [Melioribacteraceae bacterium]
MKQNVEFILNNKKISVIDNPAKTLLDFIRVDEGLKGTKEGCREGDCGACTVLIGEVHNGKVKYKSVNSCLFPIGNAVGKHVVTIEGLNNESLTPIQEEFNNEGASQCGFCTPGFVNSLTGYVIENEELHTHDAENALAGNICRCTGYASIKRTAENVISRVNKLNINGEERIKSLVKEKNLPNYFLGIEEKLKQININKLGIAESKKLIGGGTDLFVQKADALLNEEVSFSKDLTPSEINVVNNFCQIGAGVTIEQVKNSEIIKNYFTTHAEQLNLFASLPIRNSATIGGNIVNASPIGDSTIIFLALNSDLIIKSKSSTRKIKLSDFYKGYKDIDLFENEFVEEIVFELPNATTTFNFEKVSKRTHLDIASVNSAIMISTIDGTIDNIVLSAGGISPIPLYLEKTSRFLFSQKINSEIVLEALNIAQLEISPISDIRGSDQYKKLLLSQLIKAHFIKLFSEQIDVEVLL